MSNGITYATVSSHSSRILHKTGCRSAVQLGVWAVEHGIVDIADTTKGQSSPRLGADVSPTYRSPAGTAGRSGQALRAALEGQR